MLGLGRVIQNCVLHPLMLIINLKPVAALYAVLAIGLAVLLQQLSSSSLLRHPVNPGDAIQNRHILVSRPIDSESSDQ